MCQNSPVICDSDWWTALTAILSGSDISSQTDWSMPVVWIFQSHDMRDVDNILCFSFTNRPLGLAPHCINYLLRQHGSFSWKHLPMAKENDWARRQLHFFSLYNFRWQHWKLAFKSMLTDCTFVKVKARMKHHNESRQWLLLGYNIQRYKGLHYICFRILLRHWPLDDPSYIC